VKPNDLRGILHYIPRFRGKIFVIAVDGAIVSEENFANVLLDIAVLRSLNIRVVLAHGAAFQINELAEMNDIAVSNLDGEGETTEETLELAMTAGNRVAHEILEGFATHDLRAAVTNAIKALPVGIIRGVNQLNTGKVEKIDVKLLAGLLDSGVIPVVPPLGFDGNGRTFRVNSDSIAVSIAEALGAVKLIFVTDQDGIFGDGQVIREMPASSLEEELKKESSKLGNLSKAKYAVKACHAGVPRVHVINGRTNEGLLTEVFSNEGIGTLIYANDYQQIRSARKKDVRVLVQLTRDSMVSEELSRRTRQEITRSLEDYYIFEIDRHPIGCVALHIYPEERKGELAFLCVSRSHENQGIGRRLIKYVEERARQLGVDQLFLLSTQSYTFFQSKAGFVEGSIDDLPKNRREQHVQSGRNSKILKKCLSAKSGADVRAE
jgi:amino-acid N-acetyltransferase